MNIAGYIKAENVILDMKADSKTAAIAELVENLVDSGRLEEAGELIEAVTAREELCTTGLENGVAIPHPRHGQPHLIDGLAIVIGRKPDGLDFASMDGKPTKLFILLCAESDTVHLRSLARLSRLVKDAELRKSILEADSGEAVVELIKEAEHKLE
jgi:mannitol/fructose-specific phosphotransferase system IIA component (Ntr-type)